MTRRLRTQLFAAIIRRPVSFFDQTEVGQLTSRLQVRHQTLTLSYRWSQGVTRAIRISGSHAVNSHHLLLHSGSFHTSGGRMCAACKHTLMFLIKVELQGK